MKSKIQNAKREVEYSRGLYQSTNEYFGLFKGYTKIAIACAAYLGLKSLFGESPVNQNFSDPTTTQMIDLAAIVLTPTLGIFGTLGSIPLYFARESEKSNLIKAKQNLQKIINGISARKSE